jgi:YidC/Oxa1 family membrane protein insertase
MFILEAFTTFIYQPFLNILVGIYWVLGFGSVGAPDMGIAVILLAVLIRVLLLPLSLAGDRSEEDRREIARKVQELEVRFQNDPESFKKARKKIFSRKREVLIGEMFSLFIQIVIALMLWKMFETGLTGGDLHLIYGFMPEIQQPFNLLFLGRFDLTRPSIILNLLLTFLIFVFETVAVLTSPYPPTRDEIVRLQLTLPFVSFLLFLRFPAGKLLFVLVTMVFSTILIIGKYIYHRFMAYKAKKESIQNAELDESKKGEIVKIV